MSSIDRIIDQAMRPVADAVASVVFFAVPAFGADLPLIVVWLVGGGAGAIASSAATALPARTPALGILDTIGVPPWRADPITRRRTRASEGVTPLGLPAPAAWSTVAAEVAPHDQNRKLEYREEVGAVA